MVSAVVRPTWDEYWVQTARGVATRSLCSRDQVGAVIVDMHNEIVSSGWNGPPSGFVHNDQPCLVWCARANADPQVQRLDPGYVDCPSLHAESNALMMSEKARRRGGTIYVTSHVCFSCSKLVANSGLSRLVVAPAHDHAHRDPGRGYTLLLNCGMKVDVL
jgi:dCMP deaminase